LENDDIPLVGVWLPNTISSDRSDRVERAGLGPGDMKYAVQFDIQTYDCDFAGGISNTTYVRWLDELRTGWFDSVMARSRQQSEALILVVGRLEMDYLYTVGYYDGSISGEIVDAEVGNSRVIFQARFCLGEKEVVRAVQKTLLVNLEKRRPARMPLDVMKVLQEDRNEHVSE